MQRIACAIGGSLPPTPRVGARGGWHEGIAAPVFGAVNERHGSSAATTHPADRSRKEVPPRRTPGRTDTPRRPPFPAATGNSTEQCPTPRGSAPPKPPTTPPECALSEPPAGKQCPSGCKSSASPRFDAPSEPPAEKQRPSGEVPTLAPPEPPAAKQRLSGEVSNPPSRGEVASPKRASSKLAAFSSSARCGSENRRGARSGLSEPTESQGRAGIDATTAHECGESVGADPS